MSAFSCLPPIIRHITLSALYDDDPYNSEVIDKLVLAKLKAFSKDVAEAWIEDHKEALLAISVGLDSESLRKLIATIGPEAALSLVTTTPVSMYHACKEKLSVVDASLNSKPLYSDFESAKGYYELYGIVEGISQDVIEFNDLMEFVYIGRRKNEIEIGTIPEEGYIINQIVAISPKLWELGNS